MTVGNPNKENLNLQYDKWVPKQKTPKLTI